MKVFWSKNFAILSQSLEGLMPIRTHIAMTSPLLTLSNVHCVNSSIGYWC